MIPTLPSCDAVQRSEALREYAILDTPPDQPLDDLTALAAHICGTPIAAISLIDGRRQWFKAKFGLDLTETPLEVSFCAHAVDQPGLFIVPDASQDQRFADNPLVTGEPGIRFYAGAPLVTPGGAVLTWQYRGVVSSLGTGSFRISPDGSRRLYRDIAWLTPSVKIDSTASAASAVICAAISRSARPIGAST